MSLTEMVIMPGEDYQKLCDNLRTALRWYQPICSNEAAGMIVGLCDERDTIESVVTGTIQGEYYNANITTLRAYAFAYAKKITKVRLPQLTSAGGYAFTNCTGLVRAEFPFFQAGGTTALFGTCTELKHVDLGQVDSLTTNTFLNCSKLESVVLRRSSVSALSNINAFSNTPFANGGAGGKIYVPKALIETYKTATNWSVLHGYGTCEFVAIEGSEFE